MKPRNFIINILLILTFIAEIVLVLLAKAIDWKLIFIGIAGICVLIPDFILKPKHKAFYIVYKSLSQVGLIALGVITCVLGFVFSLAFGLAEGFAQGCGGSVSHTELDKFTADFIFYLFIPIIAKLIMNIVDFALFRRELKKYNEQINW